MLRVNEFRKFFMHVLLDYCEDTCTTQDEVYNKILYAEKLDTLFDMFVEEGFMEWNPSTFPCIGNKSLDDVDFHNLEVDDPLGLTCVEQFWRSVCEQKEIEFTQLIAVM